MSTPVSRPRPARRRTLSVLLGLVVLMAALTAGTGTASALTCVSAQAPYKHTRITGQKMVYAHSYSQCAASNLRVTATLYKWNGSGWVKYGLTQSSSNDAFANEFLCSNYGWGGSGSGYFANRATASWSTPYGTQSQTIWSGSRHLSC